MKYIKRIIIDNFQSHEHSELEFDSGLNIIVGESDKGKSAILRALKWVLYNEPRGTEFVRFGANETSVTIVTGDGFTVTRKRKSNKNTYTVINPNGEKLEFENFGNDVPNEVIEATGIKKIKLDTDLESKLNLNEQLDPPFLLSETGSIRAKAIGRIVNTNILDAAERDILKDISNNNAEFKTLEKQLSDIDEELLQYTDIDEQENKINKIDSLLEKLKGIEIKASKLSELKTKIDYLDAEIIKNKSLLSNLKYVPQISDTYNILKEKYSNSNRLCLYRDKLHNIENDISQNSSLLNKVKNVEEAENITKNLDLKIQNYKKVFQLKEKLSDVSSKITKGSEYMTNLNNELKHYVSEYSLKLKHLGKCPTCFSAISENVLNEIISELEGE